MSPAYETMTSQALIEGLEAGCMNGGGSGSSRRNPDEGVRVWSPEGNRRASEGPGRRILMPETRLSPLA